MYVLKTTVLIAVICVSQGRPLVDEEAGALGDLTGSKGLIGKQLKNLNTKTDGLGKTATNFAAKATNAAGNIASKTKIAGVTGVKKTKEYSAEMRQQAKSKIHHTDGPNDSVHQAAMDTVLDISGDDVKLKTLGLLQSKKTKKGKNKTKTTPEPEEEDEEEKEDKEEKEDD